MKKRLQTLEFTAFSTIFRYSKSEFASVSSFLYGNSCSFIFMLFPQQLHTAASSSFVFLLYFRIFLPPVYQKTFLSSFLTQNRNQILLCPVDCNTSFPPFLLGMKGKSCTLNAYTITISLYRFGTDSSVRLISTASSFGRS